ncbi:DNA modification methylase [Prevotella sp. TF12-30]|uniref:Eco57I restriction-modification methylase domain-containing protein n=1 Tax=Prevotellaceae TaxID=171552 RepID=UPI000E43A079|nr:MULTISPECIES: TaqI-like C-terminal specificity domain-containing protein [Prevotellaceae]RGK35559.1 DNA modification methylase [Prevotella sp. TF12-30]
MATYNKETFKRLFQSKFNLSKWQMLLQDYFHADKVRVSPEVLDEDAEDRKGYFLGSMTTQDNYELGFFYYEMEDGSVLRRKVGLCNLIRPYLGYGFDAALAVFNDGTNWRLSLICDLKEDATSTKRFTYVFGDEKAFYKTPILRFESLRTKANEFLEIKKAFSVEALSDDFFDEYRKQYAEFVKFLTGKEYVKKGNKWVEQKTGEPDAQYFTSFKEDDKLVRDYIKKMMGRIVFLYFLQSKGWLAGNLHYMHDLFYDASDEAKENFLDKVLEPMFFGLLNTKPEDRSSAPLVNGVGVKYIPNAGEIPYLNGGLFQQEKIDEVESVFPAGMFQSLFDFFDSYNFTIDENDPNDAEVGVDPEMLGKIFENLLEDNKDKGAFYTPKEIVRYMCQESLTAYLQTGIEDAEVKEHIANFVKTNDVEELGGASSELAMSIDQKLIDVKICDPAIGSGAFPMGLLRELYACRKSIEIFEEDNAADIKRHIIQNNIYGVDIEKGAVDIARLRFWLALIIDEKEPMPLPNLDFKIMQGNSLLESYKGVDLDVTSKKLKTGKDTKKTRGVLSLGFEETDVQKTIQDLVKSYFSITDHTLRAQRRQQIDKYVKDYIKVCAEGNHEVQDAVDELEIPNDQFFLWHTYFADVFEKGGFDIVIGNPPYGVSIKDDYRKAVVASWGNVPDYEIYYYFIVLAAPLLKEKGIMSYIIPNTFLFNTFAKHFREMLVEKWNVLEILDCTKFPIFESAVVRNAINLFQKDSEGSKQVGYRNTANVTSFSDLLERERVFMTVESLLAMNQNWGLAFYLGANDIKVINQISSSIDSICNHYDVSQGYIPYRKSDLIKIYGKEEGERIVKERLWHSQQPLDNTYIQEIYGRDITKYSYHSTGEYVKYGKHLACYVDLKFFNSSRLLVREITNPQIIACLLDELFVNDPQLISVIVRDERYSLEFLWGILNSKLATYYHFHHSPKATKGAFPKILVQDIKGFPLPIASDEQISSLGKVSKKVLTKKKSNLSTDTSVLENQIDFLVYHLYGLTYDEVLIVDPKTPISREEYEAYKEE